MGHSNQHMAIGSGTQVTSILYIVQVRVNSYNSYKKMMLCDRINWTQKVESGPTLLMSGLNSISQTWSHPPQQEIRY